MTIVHTGYVAIDSDAIMLPARPEPLRLKPSETAVIVVDMQNAYASKGGYIDIAGFDVSGAPLAISRTKTVLDAARAAGLTVIFFQNGWDADYVEAGGFMSYGPNAQTVFRELAPYVARILKGETPATLPIGHPRVFEIAINLRAAKSFGFTVPSATVTNANLVIE